MVAVTPAARNHLHAVPRSSAARPVAIRSLAVSTPRILLAPAPPGVSRSGAAGGPHVPSRAFPGTVVTARHATCAVRSADPGEQRHGAALARMAVRLEL